MYASERIIKETVDVATKSVIAFIDVIQSKYLHETPNDFNAYLSSVKFCLKEFSKLPKNSKYVEPLVLNFCSYVTNKKRKFKEIFFMPIKKVKKGSKCILE